MERVTATPALLLALLIAIAYSADRTALSSQIASIEAERDLLHGRVDLVEQAFTALLAQSSALADLPARRGLQEATATSDRATVRVDAPDGISEIILGGGGGAGGGREAPVGLQRGTEGALAASVGQECGELEQQRRGALLTEENEEGLHVLSRTHLLLFPTAAAIAAALDEGRRGGPECLERICGRGCRLHPCAQFAEQGLVALLRLGDV